MYSQVNISRIRNLPLLLEKVLESCYIERVELFMMDIYAEALSISTWDQCYSWSVCV